MSEYIEFKVNDLARFKLLLSVFQKIKADKDNDSFLDTDEYLKFFDEKAKSYFGWYSEEEIKRWSKRWFSTPIEKRWTDPNLKMKWNFGSMLACFKDGNYDLLSCEMISEEIARINYHPFAFPYGGTGCMQALIESFGFEVIEISDE